MEDYSALQAELDARYGEQPAADEGDKAEATSSETPEQPVVDTETPQEEGQGDNGSTQEAAPTATEEPVFNSAEFLRQHPELEPMAKSLQADYTRKMQQIAEQRKQYEQYQGREEKIQALLQLDQLADQDPLNAAALLEQEAQRLRGFAMPQQGAYQPGQIDLDDLTDNERLLLDRLQQAEARLNQLGQESNLSRSERAQAVVDRQFTELEKEFGQIPFEERQAAERVRQQFNLPPDQAALVWKAQHGVERARTRARDEALRVYQQKAGLAPPPAGITTRQSTAPPEPKSAKEAILLGNPHLAE